MRVTFMATADDLVDVSVRAFTRHPGALSAPRKQGVWVGAVFGTVVFLFAPVSVEVRVLLGLLTLFGWAVVHPWLYWRFVARRLRRYCQSSLGGESAFEVQVELAPEGVRVQQFGNALLYPWGNIEGITDGPDSLDFWTRPDGMLAVRKRAFTTPAQMDAFLDLADSYLSRGSPERGRGG